MTRSYSRDDVETHSDGWGRGRPAVNVKIYRDIRDAWQDYKRAERSDPRFTLDWIEEHVSEQSMSGTFWQTCEFEFENLEGWATGREGDSLFPDDTVTLHQTGRSGGWIEVDGLPDLEEWDAVRLARWRKFERVARQIADGVPMAMLSSLEINEFAAWVEEQDDAATYNDAAPVDVAARLEYLRGELRAERISWGELHELQGLAPHIDPSDVELLEAAGVPEVIA